MLGSFPTLKTYAFASSILKNRKIALTALALELYGATEVPDVGPFEVVEGEDVWSLACTLQ